MLELLAQEFDELKKLIADLGVLIDDEEWSKIWDDFLNIPLLDKAGKKTLSKLLIDFIWNRFPQLVPYTPVKDWLLNVIFERIFA